MTIGLIEVRANPNTRTDSNDFNGCYRTDQLKFHSPPHAFPVPRTDIFAKSVNRSRGANNSKRCRSCRYHTPGSKLFAHVDRISGASHDSSGLSRGGEMRKPRVA